MVSIKPSPELLAKLALHKAKATSAIDHSQIQGSNYTIYWDHTYPGHALLNGYPSIFSTVPQSHRVTLIVTGYECRTVKTMEAAKAFLAAIPGVETVIIPESAKEDLHMGILRFKDHDTADSAFFHLGDSEYMTADGKYQLSFRRKYPEAVPVEVKDLHTMWLHTPSLINLGKFARFRQLQQKVADDLSKQDATRLEIIDIRVPNASSPYTGVILVDYDNIEYFTEQKVINTKAGELLYQVHVGELPPEVQQLILGRREPEPYSIAMSKVPLTLTVNAVTSALHKLALLSNAKFRSIRLIHVNRPQGYKVYQLIVGTEGEFISVLGYNRHKQARIGNTFMLLSTSKSSIVSESNPRDTNLVANVQKALA